MLVKSKYLFSATLLMFASTLCAQPAFYEEEPNDTPAEATEISGELVLIGTMSGGDQDGFTWTVSDVDAQKRWTFELQGIPGKLTVVDVIRVIYADNGVDVQKTDKLFTLGSRDGLNAVVVEDLLFEPGEYVLGFASAGGSAGLYRPPSDNAAFNQKIGAQAAAEETVAAGYRLTIRHGNSLHLESRPQPRSTKETAFKLRPGAESAAYLESPQTWFLFNVTAKETDQRWDIEGQVPVGHRLKVNLYAPDASLLASTTTDAKGKFSFPDLGLEIGSYPLELSAEEGGFIRALKTTAVGELIEGSEAEPNDRWKLANRVDLKQAFGGRMGKAGETDFFRFALDEATTDQVLTLQLSTSDGQKFTFCLTDDKGKDIHCRVASGGVELTDLVLTPGIWGLSVRRGPEAAEYSVSLSTGGAIAAGIEAEPNDKLEFATAIPAKNRIKGKFSGKDADFYKVIITDKPQLWRIQVIGDKLYELAYYDGAGIESQRFRVPQGQRRIRLENVFMLPGIHHIRVSGSDGGNYTLLMRPLGPPNPNGEVEPNDDRSRMQPLRIGQTRTGLLEDKNDRDNYRYYQADWDRIRISIEPPIDAEVLANLYWDNNLFKQFNNPKKGEQFTLEGVFPPGDYRLELKAKTTSEAEYKVGLQRLERFGCPIDCEPNDSFAFASDFPQNHIIEGRVNEWRDDDWFKLPVFEQSTEITLATETSAKPEIVSREDLQHSIARRDNQEGHYQGILEAGRQYYLQVSGSANSAYRIEVRFNSELDLPAQATETSIKLSLDLETLNVGAYRAYAQKVPGTLTISNPGPAPVDVGIESATSENHWRLELENTQLTLAAGSEEKIPLSLLVPADAWADRPVRVSVQAKPTGGIKTEAFVDVSAGRETLPVNPRPGWAIPEALLGGFNLAWNALGGRWTGKEDGAIGWGFPMLFDGMAVEGEGMTMRGGRKSDSEIIIELAGSQPVEVLGLILNSLSEASALTFLRNVDFALSLDGLEFIPVIEDELLPLRGEQAFLLKQPMTARYARLRLKYGFGNVAYLNFSLGEIKVIARPGIDISNGEGFNLADPELGGHVSWSNPATTASSDWDSSLLTSPDKSQSVRLKPGQLQDFVIGFQHVRAAQITRIEWLDLKNIDPSKKFKQVSLSASIDSPLGPWQPIGDWDLSDTGSPAVFEFEQPVWARYVKFSASAESGSGQIQTPAQIKIWERAVDDSYLSILGEWGFASQAAIYEHQQPLKIEQPLLASGHTSKASAAELKFGQRVSGQVALGRQQHWYHLQIPPDKNTLSLTLSGEPTLRTVAALENIAEEAVPLRKISEQNTSQKHVYEALVEPGKSYYLNVEEPPRNVLFLWDTSPSVAAYTPIIYTALMAYAEGVVPGRDSVNMLPFGGNLLLDDWYGEPYVLQTVLNDYPRKDNSSAAEASMAIAAKALAPRAGTKAIVLITDAATNRFPPMWDEFQQVQPRVFALGLGSQGAFGGNPPREQDLMQDWSRVNGGHYTHMLSAGDMEVAFDRATTMLRRPAGYTLEANTAFKQAPGPGTLKVVSSDNNPSGAIELILDASGSMLKRLDGKRRINIAKAVLIEAVKQSIPAGTPLALRVFGHKQANACRTDLEFPLKPLEPAAAEKMIQSVNAKNLAKTPIADSLAMIESDLKSAKGRKIIVLVTDGEETCEGKPEEVILKLQNNGLDISLNIVGFAIDDAVLETQFQQWANLGGGRYFSANSQEGLSDALNLALQVPFTVYDTAGSIAGEGVVGGELLELEQGFYRVVVQTSPPQIFEKVEITGEQTRTIEY